VSNSSDDHYWLSDTPDVVGSNTWGGVCVCMVTWVRFRDRGDGERQFYVLNTHLGNGSRYARARAAALIGQRIAGLDRSLPLIVTGDFTVAAHKNTVYDTMLSAGPVDTWDTAAERGPLYGMPVAGGRNDARPRDRACGHRGLVQLVRPDSISPCGT